MVREQRWDHFVKHEKIYSSKEEQKVWGPIFLDEDDDEFDIQRKESLARLRKKAIEADKKDTVDLSGLSSDQLRRSLFS